LDIIIFFVWKFYDGEINVSSFADLITSERIAAGSSRRSFASGVPLKLSDSSYCPRAIIVHYSRVFYTSGCPNSERRRRESRRDIEYRRSNLAVNIFLFFAYIKSVLFSVHSLVVLFCYDLKMTIKKEDYFKLFQNFVNMYF